MTESDPTRTFSPSPLQFLFPTNRTDFGLIATGGHAPFAGIALWHLGPELTYDH
jgi:hypothetical protein